jgi:penicillin amidase
MVVNDPHLDNRILPGTWHPVGLFAPGVQAVGAALPGMPGILVGRTKHVAFGVTNAYGDVQDLYVETVDPANPQRYLDGGRSVPFEVVTETIRHQGQGRARRLPRRRRSRCATRSAAPSSPTTPGLGPKGDKLLVLRSTDAEVLAPVHRHRRPADGARRGKAFDREVQKMDLMMFNFVFGDDQGAIAHRATGAVPIRAGADGGFPRLRRRRRQRRLDRFHPQGPHARHDQPATRAWVGTANNDTTPQGFPWYYTNYVSPNYRYRRMGEVLGAAQKMTVDDHLEADADDRNLQSDVLRRNHRRRAEGNDPAQQDLATIAVASGMGWTAPTRPRRCSTRRCTARSRSAPSRDKLGEDVRQRHALDLVLLAAAF